jgi:hypothetical protein
MRSNYIIRHNILVISIQRANRSRLSSFSSRTFFFNYMWELLKVEVSKVLMTDKKQAAKTLSCNLFAISEKVRDHFFQLYNQHQRLIFIEKFMVYRQHRCHQLGVPFTFDWDEEKPRVDSQRRLIEQQLYEGLDEQAREIVNAIMAKQQEKRD